jgi:hypothetical protein
VPSFRKTPFAPRFASIHWSGQGRAKFVMDEDGNVYASLNGEADPEATREAFRDLTGLDVQPA